MTYMGFFSYVPWAVEHRFGDVPKRGSRLAQYHCFAKITKVFEVNFANIGVSLDFAH